MRTDRCAETKTPGGPSAGGGGLRAGIAEPGGYQHDETLALRDAAGHVDDQLARVLRAHRDRIA